MTENTLNQQEANSLELIKKRMIAVNDKLKSSVVSLNNERKQAFKPAELKLQETLTLENSHNTLPVDLVYLDDSFIVGLKNEKSKIKKTTIDEIFSVFDIKNNDIENFEVSKIKFTDCSLNDAKFVAEFDRLFQYYNAAEFHQFIKEKNKLFIVFKIGTNENDLKAYSWEISGSEFTYTGEVSGSDVVSKIYKSPFQWKQIHAKVGERKLEITSDLKLSNLDGKIQFFDSKDNVLFSRDLMQKLQSLQDAKFYTVNLDDLVLIKAELYGENTPSYFIYDVLIKKIVKAESLDSSGVILPEDNGIIYANGFYIKGGNERTFDVNKDSYLHEVYKSPNGEDFLYAFYNKKNKSYAIYTYNLITKEMVSPLNSKGYALLDNGGMIVLKDSSELTKIHYAQMWKTAFFSETHYEKNINRANENRVSKVGNSEIVKAIGAINNITNFVSNKNVNVQIYKNIIKMIGQIVDTYHWLTAFEDLGILTHLNEEKFTAEQVIAEFKKVDDLKTIAKEKMETALVEFEELNTKTRAKNDKIDYMMSVLIESKTFTGKISSLKNERYIDVEQVELLLKKTNERLQFVNNVIIGLLNKKETYEELIGNINTAGKEILAEDKYKTAQEKQKALEEFAHQLSYLNQEISSLDFEENSVLSEILEHIAKVFATLNQVKVKVKKHVQSLAIAEAEKDFASHSKLLEQSVKNALNNAETIEQSEEEYSKILATLENLETRFSEFNIEEFSLTLAKQREDIASTFANHKEKIQDEQQKKINNLRSAIDIGLRSVKSKVSHTSDIKVVSSIFLTDGIVLRIKKLLKELNDLGAVSLYEELSGELLKTEKDAIKRVKDDLDIFEDNGNILKLGNSRFAVNKKPFDITLIRKDNKFYSHVETTDYLHEIKVSDVNPLVNKMWNYDFISESAELYRSEYLVYSILTDAENNLNGLSKEMLADILSKGSYDGKVSSLLNVINNYSDKLYKEGYIKGIHDVDAEKILEIILKKQKENPELLFSNDERIDALLILSKIKAKDAFVERVKKAFALLKIINSSIQIEKIKKDVKNEWGFNIDTNALKYISTIDNKKVAISKSFNDFYVEMEKVLLDFINDWKENYNKESNIVVAKELINELQNLLEDYCIHSSINDFMVKEAIYFILAKENGFDFEVKNESSVITIDNTIGDHPVIKDSKLIFTIDDFYERNQEHREVVMPVYEQIDKIKVEELNKEKDILKIDRFKSKPLSSFVKNKLITESYFPKFGSNLAKQIGETGSNKKADTMGLLLLTSPPGYGKTTLVEYVVNKLGLVFVKVNCPSIGHDVVSLDPNEAPDLTSKKEIEKINLAFEMGNNVCLYLDDIQHTNPEFLQKFIPLCDGTRTIEGVWENNPKTYNLRNKRFFVVMAGNPYTESGEMFKVPDMLANRADTYNLGEMSQNDKAVFEMSYIENALTNNIVTEPLTNRSSADIELFIKISEGHEVDKSEFEYTYSSIEINEIVNVLKIMKKVQNVVLKVNQAYIYSASQHNDYRTEPAFKLQGSYRNMTKMSEKILPLMTAEEVDELIMDHYISEAQTLTSSNEENVLKFKEIIGVLTDEEKLRWDELKRIFCEKNTNNEQMALSEMSKNIKKLTEYLLN